MSESGHERDRSADNPLERADPTGQSGSPVAVAIFVGVLLLVLVGLLVVGVVVLG